MRILIVEDDFASRRLLQKYLAPYGECDIVVDGQEAVDAFLLAWEDRDPYDFICLDIMLPRMDGLQVLKRIREEEKSRGILGLEGVKVLMTTALNDARNIIEAFNSQCEAYLPKPLDRRKLLEEMEALGLIRLEERSGS